MYSFAEENYLKTIYFLTQRHAEASTSSIAEYLQTKPASVSDMVKRLAEKNLVRHIRYKGTGLTPDGRKVALQIIRKHRLWEVFLVEKLKFNWDEVHEIAEQLEHIKSPLLIARLDEFLGHPTHDPHGDPIPDADGELPISRKIPLAEGEINQALIVKGVKDSSSSFLKYLDKVGIYIGVKLKILDKIEYDGSSEVVLNDEKTLLISKEVSHNILVEDVRK